MNTPTEQLELDLGEPTLDPKQLTDHQLILYCNSLGVREDDIWFKELAERAAKYLRFYDDVNETWDD